MQLVDENGLIINNSVGNKDIEFNRLLLLFVNVFVHPSMTIRKEVLANYKYKKNYTYSEDYELWTRMIQKHNIAYLPFIHIAYKAHRSQKKTKEFHDKYPPVYINHTF